jgi:uncharacterized protein (TIGR00661 family)
MKILYAIQGTGNGHLTRAIEIYPYLAKVAEVDILVSGLQYDLSFPFPIKYSYYGLGFVFGKKGGINLIQTYKKNKVKRFVNEINDLPINDYDLIISDFEPISAWAAFFAKKPCLGLSNQAALLKSDLTITSKKFIVGKFILHNYAPCGSQYGFNFKITDNQVFTPIIRDKIREIISQNNQHITVYLPAYHDKYLESILSQLTKYQFEVFSKYAKHKKTKKNITIFPISDQSFAESMATSAGIFCSAGFGTTSEAVFLKKKLLILPMKGQIEQYYNALMLKEMGAHVLKNLKVKQLHKIQNWIENAVPMSADYPNNTGQIIDQIMEDFRNNNLNPVDIIELNGSLKFISKIIKLHEKIMIKN